ASCPFPNSFIIQNNRDSGPLRRGQINIQQASQAIADPAERLATEARHILERASQDHIWGWLIYSMSDRGRVPDDLLSFPRTDLVVGHRNGRFKFTSLACANDLVVSALRRALRSVLEQDHGKDYASNMLELLLNALGLPEEEARAIAMRPLASLPQTSAVSAIQQRNNTQT
ncbi:MAG: hypothetical protein QHC67_07485, partial [Sphingobium sp.]|uniref:hypothetical protein n=1 Tax=Sphingobium sp. TaxID=1912891 RepID=UPI00299F98F1